MPKGDIAAELYTRHPAGDASKIAAIKARKKAAAQPAPQSSSESNS